jgi:FkbM family methyltransferase
MLLDRLGSLFRFLAEFSQFHARDSVFYGFVDAIAKHAFSEARPAFEVGQPVMLAEVGSVYLPFEQMGAVDSVDLFGLDELILFAYYHRNRGRYRRVADIGANIGLHSIVLSKCGFEVEAFEPDPIHHTKLVANLRLNGMERCNAHLAAVSDSRGKREFVRVLGNTTGSHLAGAKPNPYGALERFDVELEDVKSIAPRVDLMKIDAEGHEGVILTALPLGAWERVDALVEIASAENARLVFEHLARGGVNVFVQKRGWSRAQSVNDMPVSYKEGSIFVSAKPSMPW